MKALILAAAISLLSASAASAQISNFWLSAPGPTAPAARPTPAARLHLAPLEPAPGIHIEERLRLRPGFTLIGPWPPLWIGPREIAILGKRGGHTVMIAFQGNRFAQTRTLIDFPPGKRTLLDLALSPGRKDLAVASATAAEIEIRLVPADGKSPARTIATIKGDYVRASLSWLDPKTLIIGAAEAPPPADGNGPPTGTGPRGHLYLLSLTASPAPREFDPGCPAAIDPLQVHWSKDGSLAIAYGSGADAHRWYLIERRHRRCTALDFRGLIPARLLEWGSGSDRFLFTALPQKTPEAAAMGVFEYSIPTRSVRRIAAPAAVAAYTGDNRVATLGSRSLRSATLAASPNGLISAEIGWLNATRTELRIVPLGVTVRAISVMNGMLSYSDAHKMLAVGIYAPARGGDFPALLWLSPSLLQAGIIASGQSRGLLYPSWSLDGSKIAVIAGKPGHPLAAILQAPR